MPITVELQDMHSYSYLMIVFVAIFVAFSVGLIVFIIIKHCRKSNKNARPKVEMTPVSRQNIKQKYSTLLSSLEQKCREEKISNRKAYQELSKIIRHFVYEATGIKVHNYTLQEIKETNISGLYDVISECYTPEFAIDKSGEIYSSISKARKVVEEWN